jgi:hypothetical protein
VGSNTHILSARRRSTPPAPYAAAAASFNPKSIQAKFIPL